MTDKDLKKLSRSDMLEMLIQQSKEIEMLREKLAAADLALEEREIAIDNAGSIAEAALQINGVFEAAQAAGQQYLDNLSRLSERQKFVCERLEENSRQEAERRIAETKKMCEDMEAETAIECAEMIAKAKAESQAHWDELSAKLDQYYNEHVGLRELLSMVTHKNVL